MRVSVGPSEEQAVGFAFNPSISADGRYVAFHSSAANLVTEDTNSRVDVFFRDRGSATDADGDVDVDLIDFYVFQNCFNGPNRPPRTSCCSMDFDWDGDVDLIDFYEFQRCFNGPNRPPRCQ
jgi:hypothetical protein